MFIRTIDIFAYCSIFFEIILAANDENCLLWASLNACQYCKAGYYLNQSSNSLEQKCIQKLSTLNNQDRTVYISPRPATIDLLQNLSSSYTIYTSLIEALKEENDKTSSLLETNLIRIKFLKGQHYILENDILNAGKSSFFVRTNIDLVIEPLTCNIATEKLLGMCFDEKEYVNINLKTSLLKIFVTKSLTISLINFDAVDSGAVNVTALCKNQFKTCCGTDPNNLCKKFYESESIFLDNYKFLGFFILEPVFDDALNTLSSPQLSINNTIFRNFMVGNPNVQIELYSDLSPSTLILIYDFQGNITITNCLFEGLLFPGGLIHKKPGIRPVLNNIQGLVINFDPYNSLVVIESTVLSYYNGNKMNIVNGGSILMTVYSALFTFIDLKGNFTIKNSQINENWLPKDNFLTIKNTKKLLQASNFNILSNNISGCTFLSFSKAEEDFTSSAISIKIIDIKISRTNLYIFLIVKHVKDVTINNDFTTPFYLPERTFIQSAYSIVKLINSRFTYQSPLVNDYYLVEIISTYNVPFLTVFATSKRKKGVFYSNETTVFRNCTFNKVTFNLIISYSLNYILLIDNCSFSDINTLNSLNNPYIDIISEGPFMILISEFSNYESSSPIIYVFNFLNITLRNLNFLNIKMRECNLLEPYSSTNADPIEHQFIMTDINVNSLLIFVPKEKTGRN